LIIRDNSPDCLFILANGQLQKFEDEKLIETYSKGSLIGGEEILYGILHNYSYLAVDDLEFWFLEGEILRKKLQTVIGEVEKEA